MKLLRTACAILVAAFGVGLQCRAAEIHNAVRAGDIPKTFALIKAEPAVVAAVTEDNTTALHIAALEGNTDLAELLLTNNAPVNAADSKKQTPLHLAMFSGNRTVAELLLDHGAEINARDLAGRTAMHLVARKGDREMVEFLLERKADATLTDGEGKTAAETAAANGHLAVAELIQRRLTVLVGSLGDPACISFQGLKTYKPEQIVSALKSTVDFLAISHPLAPLSEYLLALQKRIDSGYRMGGFPDAQVRVRHDSNGGKLVVEVEEGQRYFCGDVRVRGGGLVPASEITAKLLGTNQLPKERTQTFVFQDRPSGSPFTDPAARFPFGVPLWNPDTPTPFLEENLHRFGSVITNMFEERGFFFPDFKIQIIPDPATGKAQLQVDIVSEGPRTRFDPIEIVGNTRNGRDELLKYLALKPGMEATGSLLRQVEQRLWASARFLTNSISLGSPGADGRVPLRIGVLEYGPAPSLSEEFPEAEKGLLKSRDWLAGLGRRNEDLVLDGDLKSSKVSEKRIRLRGLLSPVGGLALSVCVDERTNCAYAVVITTNFAGLFCPIDQRKYVVPTRQAQLHITTAVSAGPTNKHGSAFTFTLGAGFSRKLDGEPPYQFEVMSPPVAYASMRHRGEFTNWLDGDVLTLRDQVVTMALDAKSGRIKQFQAIDDDPAVTISGRFETASLDKFVCELEAQMTTVPNAYSSNRPFSSLLTFLAETGSSPKFRNVFAGLKIPQNLSLTPELIRKLDVMDALAPLDRLIPQIADSLKVAQDPDFVIPETYSLDIIGVAARWITRNADELFPKQSWLWTAAREAGFVAQGRAKYTDQALQGLLDSSDTGPLACLALSHILLSFQPVQSREFASRGLSRLSPEDFLRDCRTLLDTNAMLGQCLVKLVASLPRLEESELTALTGAGSGPAAETLLACWRRLREPPSAPMPDLLEPPLKNWWEKELKQTVEASLKDMAVDVNEVVRKAVQLLEGRGGERDTAEATSLLRQAALKGHPGAQLFLGQILERGPDSSRNLPEAINWYGHAATNGVNAAAIALGDLYADGLSVPQDRFQAYVWYGVAARRGERVALAMRRGVERKLSEDQIAKAKKIINAIAADYSGPAIEDR
jgi:hypothetical protein